jgi:hypothetical protein
VRDSAVAGRQHSELVDTSTRRLYTRHSGHDYRNPSESMRLMSQTLIGSRLICACLGLLGLITVTSSSAEAQTVESCTAYANRAIKDFSDTFKKPRCKRRENDRWHKDYDRHYSWCMTSKIEPVNTEREVRCGARVKFD